MLSARLFAPSTSLVKPRVEVSCKAKGGTDSKHKSSEYTDVFQGRQKKFTGDIELELPDWNDEAEVVVEGSVVHTTAGTLPEYKQEVWSGNHPFYANRGVGSSKVVQDSQVKKFTGKYDNMAALSDLDALMEAIEEEDKMRTELGLGEMKVLIDKGIQPKTKAKKKGKK